MPGQGDLAFAEDHGQRRPQFVADIGEEAPAAGDRSPLSVSLTARKSALCDPRSSSRARAGRAATRPSPRLQPRRHAVEDDGEEAELVAMTDRQAQIALALADRDRRVADLRHGGEDRPRDQAVEGQRDDRGERHQRHGGARHGRRYGARVLAAGLDATPVGLHQEEQERAGEGGEAVERAAGGVAALLRVRLHERLVDLPHQDTEAGPHLGQRAGAGGHGVHVGGQVGIADRLGDLGLEMTDRGQHPPLPPPRGAGRRRRGLPTAAMAISPYCWMRPESSVSRSSRRCASSARSIVRSVTCIA